MVNEDVAREYKYGAVHGKLTPFSIFGHDRADRVEASIPSDGVPFVLGEMIVIVRVNDSVFALGERYPAEGIAVAQPAIQKHRPGEKPFQPIGNSDFENELDDFLTPADR